ncbi:MAG: TIGR02147 family protein [Chitinivibrionales bacterium]|nr:TIGR02147 family protein [Chitinivibrionales bacterium]MBD3358726.1 TIGR02147 family protein [Chitinivibrionales bacterium]
MKTQLPNIYDYNDFRAYLRDYQRARFLFDKRFSRTGMCRLLGLPNSRSYFNDIVKGKKITAAYVERFIRVLELANSEATFFRALVKFNQAESPGERELYFEQLIRLNRSPKKVLDRRMYKYYKEWYHSAIRALLDVIDCKGDAKTLAHALNPRITVREARLSIKLLLELGLISRTQEGFLKPVDKCLTTGPYVQDQLIRQYQLQCLQVASTALINQSKHPQMFSTKLVSVSPQGFRLIERQLSKFLGEVSSIVHKDTDPADRVYHLDIQLFPASRFDTPSTPLKKPDTNNHKQKGKGA